ncbi:hypothetical protein [Pseudomonas fluorescens]|uniref:Lipoprotein n=1 Tax=Pseudomonas fluorescens TaxID=294 RepID=A0A5E6Q975_PSEFL|nr:hypothetical protein [Pseudomonas fluorescens]VVM52826.1 hypothetical protein PS659_00903 [Pseudomonas fluorescens]
MNNPKLVLMAFVAVLSSSSLYAVAADPGYGETNADGSSQTREPAPRPTNADPDAASLPKGADGEKTDNGPIPAGSKPAGAGQTGSSSGGNSGGG